MTQTTAIEDILYYRSGSHKRLLRRIHVMHKRWKAINKFAHRVPKRIGEPLFKKLCLADDVTYLEFLLKARIKTKRRNATKRRRRRMAIQRGK